MQTTITNTTLVKAKTDAKPGAPRYEVTDSKATGLILRVGPRGAQWQFRFQSGGKSVRLPLGPVEVWSIPDAREIANAAQVLIRSGRGFPTTRWLETYLLRAGKTVAEVPAVVEVARTWTFAAGRAAYLDEVARTRRAGTHASYSGTLRHPALRRLDGRPLVSITRQELTGIVDQVHRSGKESSAEQMVRILRPFWIWLGEDRQIRKSGIAAGSMAGLKAPERTLDERPVSEYVPDLEEVARIIAIARSGALDPVIGCAIELLCWSVQRRRAVASAESVHFVRMGEFGKPGVVRGLWSLPPASRKSRTKAGTTKKDHVIPLPAAAFACVMRAQDLSSQRSTPYLFPQFRARTSGGPLTHVHPSTLSHTMLWLPGIKTSPHDIRRAFATHGEKELGMLRSETRAILDHGAGETDVTGRHYALHDGTHKTWDIMNKWVGALEPLIEHAVCKLESVETLKAAIDAARRREANCAEKVAVE